MECPKCAYWRGRMDALIAERQVVRESVKPRNYAEAVEIARQARADQLAARVLLDELAAELAKLRGPDGVQMDPTGPEMVPKRA